jgi:hypothetical protein
MTHKEMIEVIAAHEAGRTVECREGIGGEWVIHCGTAFNFYRYDYRVKPALKKRLMTARELAGRWVKINKFRDDAYFVNAANLSEGGNTIGLGPSSKPIEKNMVYCDDIRNPQWKSVELEVES